MHFTCLWILKPHSTWTATRSLNLASVSNVWSSLHVVKGCVNLCHHKANKFKTIQWNSAPLWNKQHVIKHCGHVGIVHKIWDTAQKPQLCWMQHFYAVLIFKRNCHKTGCIFWYKLILSIYSVQYRWHNMSVYVLEKLWNQCTHHVPYSGQTQL